MSPVAFKIPHRHRNMAATQATLKTLKEVARLVGNMAGKPYTQSASLT